MKKLLSLFVVVFFVLGLFIACDSKESVTEISEGAGTVQTPDTDAPDSDEPGGVDLPDEDSSDTYAEPVSGMELYVMQRDMTIEEVRNVMDGKYRDWISVDEVKTTINSRVGGELVTEESIEELLFRVAHDNPDLYFGTWEDLDNEHYPPSGWDRIFEIPDGGKLLFRISD